MFVYVVESSVEHQADTFVTCIEGVFATKEAARAYLANEGYVEDDGDITGGIECDGCAVSNPFRDADCGGGWNCVELVIACWEVQQ